MSASTPDVASWLDQRAVPVVVWSEAEWSLVAVDQVSARRHSAEALRALVPELTAALGEVFVVGPDDVAEHAFGSGRDVETDGQPPDGSGAYDELVTAVAERTGAPLAVLDPDHLMFGPSSRQVAWIWGVGPDQVQAVANASRCRLVGLRSDDCWLLRSEPHEELWAVVVGLSRLARSRSLLAWCGPGAAGLVTLVSGQVGSRHRFGAREWRTTAGLDPTRIDVGLLTGPSTADASVLTSQLMTPTTDLVGLRAALRSSATGPQAVRGVAESLALPEAAVAAAVLSGGEFDGTMADAVAIEPRESGLWSDVWAVMATEEPGRLQTVAAVASIPLCGVWAWRLGECVTGTADVWGFVQLAVLTVTLPLGSISLLRLRRARRVRRDS